MSEKRVKVYGPTGREVYIPHGYQARAEEHVMASPFAVLAEESHGGGGLFMDMGLGKTVATLTALNRLMFEEFEVSKPLVVAPKRVAAHTWTTEIDKWEHTFHLTASKVMGTEKERIAALKTPADIYIINRENLVWLVAYYGMAWPFDMLVLDELTSFKSAKANRFKALRQVRPLVKRVVGLTGTPSPNGLLDLWSQMYLLDRGERLGDTLTSYRGRFFRKDPYKPFAKYEVVRDPGEKVGESHYEKKIYERIGDICISMKAEDYLELPDKIFNDIPIHLDAEAKAKYEVFEREQVMLLMQEGGDGKEITAVNAAVLTNKLLQFSNGAIYDEEGKYHEIHDHKLDELENIVEQANGNPVLVFYNFRHDLERMQKRLKAHKPVTLKGNREIDDWNAGKITVMFAHPASAGHGLNLQQGGHTIVFFGLLWSLELYLQAIARLHRQGQIHTVIIHRLIGAGTMDEEVLAALDSKEQGQNALMRAIKAVVAKYVK